MNIVDIKKKIFSINTEKDFNEISIKIFKYQYENSIIYREFTDLLKIDINKINNFRKIPFLPIEFFKKYQIIDKTISTNFYFQSSGTTSGNLSKHFIADIDLYRKSIYDSFSKFIGNPKDYIFLGLLPSYLERNNSSLIYMVDYLMSISKKEENGYYLDDFKKLNLMLKEIEKNRKKCILFGVSYALLDFAKLFTQKLKNTIIIETGGMKGRKKEITKDELFKELKKSFQTKNIYSEYSMTELLSQAYSIGDNKYKSPSWMKILVRELEDPYNYLGKNKNGGINIIDLANIHSCSFISTKDMGRVLDEKGNDFEVIGRIDNSDIRGCSLLLN